MIIFHLNLYLYIDFRLHFQFGKDTGFNRTVTVLYKHKKWSWYT